MGGMRIGRVRSCCEGSGYGGGKWVGEWRSGGSQDDCSITGRDLARR